jgi:hypothetical protein
MKPQITGLLGLTAALLFAGNASAQIPPTILCSPGQVLECTSSNGAVAVVEVTVQDLDGSGLMVVWAVNGVAASTNVLEAGSTSNAVTLSFTADFGHGTNDVSVGVTDDGTNVVMCSTTVTVLDATPPVIESIVATPNVLWPPNHKMRPIRLIVRATDACGPVTWEVTSIESNEPEDGLGDGNTAPDWAIAGPHKALVRSERSGGGSGRIYTIHVGVSDLSGNIATGSVEVRVPHNRGHGKPWKDKFDDAGKGKGKGKNPGNENGNSGKGNQGKGKSKGKGK